jgi:hypothetical protein
MGATLAALGVVALTATAQASSHREAPSIANDPAADNTDLYAWVEGNNLVVLANYIPLEEPAGGPNFHSFSDDVLYEIHIVRGSADLNDDLVYQIKFTTTPYPTVDPADLNLPVGGGKEFFSQISGASQTYLVRKIENGVVTNVLSSGKVAPANIGPRTNAIAYGIPAGKSYEQFFVDDAATSYVAAMKNGGANEGRVFAGPRDDGFYVDLGAVFDLAGLRTVIGGAPRDHVAGTNTHTIALEIPLNVANGGAVVAGAPDTNQTVGVWASASRKRVSTILANGTTPATGPWRQVSRLGLPLINEAVIGLQDKDKWNRTTPAYDVAVFGGYFLNPVIVRDAEFAGFYAAGGPLETCGDVNTLKSNRLDIVDVINLTNIPSAGAHNIPLGSTGDVLRVDLGIPSGFPNGRPLVKGANTEQADVTDIELTLLLCPALLGSGVVPDGVGANDATFKMTFPYLATPWEGFSAGIRGAPAP